MNNDAGNTHPESKLLRREVFGFDVDFAVPVFPHATAHVPAIDPSYHFDRTTTRAILAGFAFNRRVLVQGFHGTGKSTHVEQTAARLNWPCMRVNLDGHLSRTDLIGKDAIVLEEGKQVTRFSEGVLPWSLRRPVALLFDEYDAGRPDVMFVIQRLLETDGTLFLFEQSELIEPHPFFRIFATANTVGLGDETGLYHGSQQINQGQMDRWNIVAKLDYLEPAQEISIVLAKNPQLQTREGTATVTSMVALANMTRLAFAQGEIATVMSPRTVITWAENSLIFKDTSLAFQLTFLNKCAAQERALIAEYYQRCMNQDLPATIFLAQAQ